MRFSNHFKILAIFSLIQIGFSTRPVSASLDLTRFRPADAAFEDDVRSFLEATIFSVMQPESRPKLPGPWRPFLEVGFQVYDVNDKRLYLYTDNGYSPASFQSLFVKAGAGLPFGITGEIGYSQIMGEHKFGGIFGSLAAQVLDFSNLVYVDLVPTMTIALSASRNLSGPGVQAFSAQTSLGAFNRAWGTQVAYVFQTTYGMLTSLDSADNQIFIRHGLVSQIPLLYNTSIRTEFFYPDLSGTLTMQYQF